MEKIKFYLLATQRRAAEREERLAREKEEKQDPKTPSKVEKMKMSMQETIKGLIAQKQEMERMKRESDLVIIDG